jgi:hypothetical protein
MVALVKLHTKQNKPLQQVYEDEVLRLTQPALLKKRLHQIDQIRPFRRLYIMGCGRSGTWLLTAVMSTFDSLDVVAKELTFEYFGLLVTNQSMLVMKRDLYAYKRVELIPESVEIAYIVRHPFDVLTSYNPTVQRQYYITPDRWLGEMLALQYLVDTKRPNTKIIRYEDLVTQPAKVQADLADFFHLTISRSVDHVDSTFNASPEAIAAMHGLRKIDTSSINKYQTDGAKLDYLKQVRARLGRLLQWVGETYQYDIGL